MVTDKRPYTLPIRWTMEEKELIGKQARKEGLTISSFVRTKIVQYCRSVAEE